MLKSLSIEDFFDSGLKLLDVRSPAEFEESHITGAINLPLLNNEQRKEIGIFYKQNGKEAAVELGYKLINPLRETFLETLKSNFQGKDLAVYCARGGLRSNKMGEFLAASGYNVFHIKGGYKSYRNFVLDKISSFRNLVIISGYTGSGKTEILHALRERGEQVLDLEGLANHKGSAFGSLGMNPQPGSAQFSNLVFDILNNYDPSKPTWVESESMKIGKVYLPKPLWENMSAAPGYEILIPLEERLLHIMTSYGRFSTDDLSRCVKALSRRLGDEDARALCDLLEANQLEPVVRRLFKYYDKSYAYGREKRDCQEYVKISFPILNPHTIAGFLLKLQHNTNQKT